MITASDITVAYAKGKGWRIINNDESCVIIMPYIIMDVAYEYYRRDIKDLELDRECKLFRKRFIESYNKFNQDLFNNIPEDMHDAVCDKMDAFRSSLYTDIISLQAKMMRCFPVGTPQERQVISALLLMNRLARFAQDFWGSFYTWRGSATCNNALNGCLSWTRKLATRYTDGKQGWSGYEMSEEFYNNFIKALDEFREKICRFVDFDRRMEMKN